MYTNVINHKCLVRSYDAGVYFGTVTNINGDGDGDGNGIRELDSHKLYKIDGVPTAILSIHGSVARAFVIEKNMFKKPCYVAKGNGIFAHGDTLRDAASRQAVHLQQQVESLSCAVEAGKEARR